MNRALLIQRLAASSALAALVSVYAVPASADMDDHHRAFTQRPGHIASVNGSSFTVDDGTTIFLHRGTVILPTGITLRPGERVTIDGFRDGRGRINADRIVVRRRDRDHR